MQQSFESAEQRLSQISIELLNRMAEIQKLRVLVEAAEASKFNRQSTLDGVSSLRPPIVSCASELAD
jgi:hypothetical protein